MSAYLLLETVRLSWDGLQVSLFQDLVLTVAKVDAYRRGGTAHTACEMLLLIFSQPATSFSLGISSAVGGFCGFSQLQPLSSMHSSRLTVNLCKGKGKGVAIAM